MEHFQWTCEICGNKHWHVVYQGGIRDGAFGSRNNAGCTVGLCTNCGVERLEERFCKDTTLYEGEDYRRLLHEPSDAKGFANKHDVLQLERLQVLGPEKLRDKVVADVGCGGGSFLDHICGLTSRTVAIEPCRVYHEYLTQKGHDVYSYVSEALPAEAQRIDIAFAFGVIEHVRNPRTLLEDIGQLLKPEGMIWVSTPNRRDILIQLLGDVYKPFFYRSVHRWYFDADSLTACARQAGFEVAELRCIHRFGLSNAMIWLRDRTPGGRTTLPCLDNAMLNYAWKHYLESRSMGDYLYVLLQLKDEEQRL